MADITYDTPTYPNVPDGFSLVSQFNFIDLSGIPDEEPIETHSLDLILLSEMSLGDIHNAMAHLQGQLTPQGYVIAAYQWSARPLVNVEIPEQFCVGDQCWDLPPEICIFGWCIPIAGQTVVSAVQYHIWVLTRQIIWAGGMTKARGFIPALAIIALVVGAVAVLPLLLAAQQVLTGKMKWSDFRAIVGDIAHAPGENAGKPFSSIPAGMAAFGLMLVAAGLFLPFAVQNVQARVDVPIGPARVGAGGTFSSGSAAGKKG